MSNGCSPNYPRIILDIIDNRCLPNFEYMKILKNGMFVPLKIIPETTVDGVRVPQRSTPKDPIEFTYSEKDVVASETSL